jgi:PAS domain S-box-containing protein
MLFLQGFPPTRCDDLSQPSDGETFHGVVIAAEPQDPGIEADGRLTVARARADLALDAAQLGEFEWDVARDQIVVSPRMGKILGVEPGEYPAENGEAVFSSVHEDDRDGVRRQLIDELNSGARFSVEFRMVHPDDGRVRWIESSGVAVGMPGGAPWKLIGVVRDITERKAAEDARETLVAELDHRVKNVLASVQSLAAQSARRTASLDSFLKTFNGRLQAMAAAHTLLSRTRWRGAEIGDVVAAELGPLAYGRARWTGPALMLTARATHAMALTLHELAANALNYGALSTEAGRVEVRWTITPDGGFELIWQERRGPPVSPPQRQGFGTMILERVAPREIGGSAVVEFRHEGVRAVLRASLNALAERAPQADDSRSRRGEERRPEVSGGDAPADIVGLKVLVVEDAGLLALELEAALAEAGATVIGPAASLDEAFAMLDRNFDVVLLDSDLGGLSAAPLAAALTRRGEPFVLTAGHGEGVAEAFQASAATVRKPYNVRQVAVALARASGRLTDS